MQKFRTFEISDPEYENDNLRFITVKTPSLLGRGDVCLFVPPDLDPGKSYPVVMLLHGVYGSAWCWALKAGVHLTALEMIREGLIPPLFLAMPSDGLWGDGSGYLEHDNRNFEKWIAEDIPDLLKQHITGITNDSAFCISGLSMGGFGALRIGAKYPHTFKAFSAHSAITNLREMELFVEEDVRQYKQSQDSDEDVLETILRNRETLPPFYFDCGKTDKLIEFNRELHHNLNKHNISHIFQEFEGGHEWAYWKKNIRNSLLFFGGQLEGSGSK